MMALFGAESGGGSKVPPKKKARTSGPKQDGGKENKPSQTPKRARPATVFEKQAEEESRLKERMKKGKWNISQGMYWEKRLDLLTLVFELVVQQGFISDNETIHPLSSLSKHIRWTLHPLVKSVVCRRWDIFEDQLLITFPPRLLLKKKLTKAGRNVYDDNPYLPNLEKMSLAKPGFHVNVDREYWRYKDIIRVQVRTTRESNAISSQFASLIHF
jgi:hypothetical protein